MTSSSLRYPGKPPRLVRKPDTGHGTRKPGPSLKTLKPSVGKHTSLPKGGRNR